MGSVSKQDELAQLMAAAQAGDGAAYERVLQQIAEIARRIVRRRIGFMAPEAIEDLVQDVLLSVHGVRATYCSDRPFMPWLFAIVRNRWADWARRHARTTAHEVAVDDLDVIVSIEDTNFFETERGDRDSLRAAIASLPRGQREAIELLKLQEMSLKEAAAAAGTTVGAMKVATHRAMAALRKRLKTR